LIRGITRVILLGEGKAMKTVKTAVSIPEEIFEETEEAAKRLGMNRSQFISAALVEFLDKHRKDKITEKLNEVYDSEVIGLDPVLAKMQFSGLKSEEW
jgi:metal-responsive CopG/Arc/MetJ family transcriptional regulator